MEPYRNVFMSGRWMLTVREVRNSNGKFMGRIAVDVCYDKICISGLSPEELKELYKVIDSAINYK